jgi:excisionase family DNA binding protein
MERTNDLLKLTIDTTGISEMFSRLLDEKLIALEFRLKNSVVALSREEAAALLKVSPNTISQYVKKGKLTNRGIGAKILVLKSDIEELISLRKK